MVVHFIFHSRSCGYVRSLLVLHGLSATQPCTVLSEILPVIILLYEDLTMINWIGLDLYGDIEVLCVLVINTAAHNSFMAYWAQYEAHGDGYMYRFGVQ